MPLENSKMNDLIHPLTNAEIDIQIQQDQHEGTFHRFVEMIDATVRTLYGPQDETISTGDARDLNASGFKLTMAKLLAKALDILDPNHPEKAIIADYVRSVMEAKRLRLSLDENTLAELDRVLPLDKS
jgi:hypothetical protein